MSSRVGRTLKYGSDLEESERSTDIGKAAKDFEKALGEVGSSKDRKIISTYKKFDGFIDRNKIILAAAALIYEKYDNKVPPANEYNTNQEVDELVTKSIELINRYGNKKRINKSNIEVKIEIYAYMRYIDNETRKLENRRNNATQ